LDSPSSARDSSQYLRRRNEEEDEEEQEPFKEHSDEEEGKHDQSEVGIKRTKRVTRNNKMNKRTSTIKMRMSNKRKRARRT